MEIGLERGNDDELEKATVKRRAINPDGTPVGIPNKNPLLDTRKFEVEYRGGTIEIIPANVIAENIMSQVDEQGYKQMMIDEIIGREKSRDAIVNTHGYTKVADKKPRTTKGWKLCIQWKDGSPSWVSLKDMKNEFPVETAHYAVKHQLQNEPAFTWWVPYVLRKQKRIIGKLKSNYWERTHKYGIMIPKSVKEAYIPLVRRMEILCGPIQYVRK